MLTPPLLGEIPNTYLISNVEVALGYIHGRLGLITGGAAGLATETTLAAVLTQLESMNDDEVLIARDTVTDILYVLQITVNEDTGVRTQAFYDVDGTPFTPTNPMELMGASDLASHVEGGTFTGGDIGILSLAVDLISGNYSTLKTSGNYLMNYDEQVYGQLQSAFHNANNAAGAYTALGEPGGWGAFGVRNDNAATDLMPASNLAWGPYAMTRFGEIFMKNATLESAIKAEDTAHVTGHTGIMALAVRNDAEDSFTDANGDYSPISVDEYGNQFVRDVYLRTLLIGLSGSDFDPSTFQGFGMLGKAVTASTYAPAYTVNDFVMPAFDAVTGRLLISSYGRGSDDITDALVKFRSITCSNTGEVIKASAGNIFRFNIVNRDASSIVVKLYNKATAATSADTPVYTIVVPGGDKSGSADEFYLRNTFTTGMSVRCVTESADAGTTSPGTSPIVEIDYK